MKNHLYGLTNIRTKTFQIHKEDIDNTLNPFLEEYNGNIIDINFIDCEDNGYVTIVILYKYLEEM